MCGRGLSFYSIHVFHCTCHTWKTLVKVIFRKSFQFYHDKSELFKNSKLILSTRFFPGTCETKSKITVAAPTAVCFGQIFYATCSLTKDNHVPPRSSNTCGLFGGIKLVTENSFDNTQTLPSNTTAVLDRKFVYLSIPIPSSPVNAFPSVLKLLTQTHCCISINLQ